VPGDLEKPPATAQTKPAVPATSDKTLVKAVDDKPQVTTPTVNPDDNAVPNTVDSSTVVMTNVVGEPNSTQPANVDGTTPAVAEAEVNKPVHTDLTVIRGIAEKTQAVLQGGEVKSLEQMAAMTPQEIQSALQKGGWGTANKMADYQDWIVQAKALIGDESPMKTSPVNANNGRAPAAEPSGPFANFPRLTSLPPLEDTSEIKIADLVIKRQYLLGAELICEKGAVRGRATFELERSNDDKQKWLVGVKKSPKHDATHIAMFRKSENAFHFQWLDAAAADKNASKMAPFLRNCFVKLILPDDESTLLTLRKPIKIPDLRLTAEALWNEVEIQIPGMPDPASIVVEVLPMRIPNVDTSIPNSRVERAMPARILLKKNDKTGFLWIQVSGELRSKLKLRSNLTLLVQGTPQPVNSLKSLQELAVTLDAAVVRSQIIHDQFTKPPQMNKGDFNKKKAALLKEAKANQAIKQKFNSYGETLPKILNQPISVRVYSKLGNYQTILAVTDPKIEQKTK
jgi:predicted flap endonuclease-1-like 5' DNA nuclease